MQYAAVGTGEYGTTRSICVFLAVRTCVPAVYRAVGCSADELDGGRGVTCGMCGCVWVSFPVAHAVG